MVLVVVLVALAAALGIYNLIRDAANDYSFSLIDPRDDMEVKPFGLEVVESGFEVEVPERKAA